MPYNVNASFLVEDSILGTPSAISSTSSLPGVAALLIVLSLALIVALLMNYEFFKRFIKTFGKVGKVFYYALVGLFVYLGGYGLYKGLTILIRDASTLLTWQDVVKGMGYFIVFVVLGKVATVVWGKIAKNIEKYRVETGAVSEVDESEDKD